MVFKRSEYGLKYKKSHLVNNIPEYYNRVAYRTHRRELEHAHTPLSWDCEDTSDSKTNSEEEVNDLLQEKLKISEDNRKCNEKAASETIDKLQKYESPENQNSKDEKEIVSKVIDREEEDEKDDKEQEKEIPEPYDKTPPKGGKTFICKPDLKLDLKEADDGKKKLKKPKAKSANRPKSSPVYKPPFMAYGCGDRERETGTKRSFNVRASNDVYPAAMKALVSLHEQQKKRETARRCLSARERKRKALILEKEAKEVAGWMSEYRRRYPQYSNEEYSRSVSRLQERPSCFKPYKF